MKRRTSASTLCSAMLLAACSTPDGLGAAESEHTQYVDTDIVHMALDVSLGDLEATATLTVAPRDAERVAFEAAGLSISEVTVDGEPVPFDVSETGLLWVESSAEELTVRYAFDERNNGDGWLSSGSTLVWPYHCGNLFPCNSNPSDGATFELAVHNASDKLVFPTAVNIESPTYVLAWAMGDYTEKELGVTSHETKISVWYLPGGEERALKGTHNLVAGFDYLESTLGEYAFGEHSGSVEADWQGGAYGGMEHHPYSHVGSDSMGDARTHVHEAAHGWFGDGVRIACWEDFVLSEGTVSYLTARAIGAVDGPEAEDEVWAGYKTRLASAMRGSAIKVAWPDGCANLDIIDDQLFSSVPYMKGAFFYRALEKRIGVDALMQALGVFYQANVGKAARMSDLLASIADTTGYDPSACANAWLREERVPEADRCE